MANNYFQYCCKYKFKNQKEKEAFDKYYHAVTDYLEFSEDEEDTYSGTTEYSEFLKFKEKFENSEFLKQVLANGDNYLSIGDVQTDSEAVYFSADEYGNVDNLDNFMRQFFIDQDSDGILVCTWAESCSKMRVDEFSGGGMVVSKERTVWVNSGQFVETEINKLKIERLSKLCSGSPSLSEDQEKLWNYFTQDKNIRAYEELSRYATRRGDEQLQLFLLSELNRQIKSFEEEIKTRTEAANNLLKKLAPKNPNPDDSSLSLEDQILKMANSKLEEPILEITYPE